MNYLLLVPLMTFGTLAIGYLYFFIKTKLMKRRFRKEIEEESKKWKEEMFKKYGINFNQTKPNQEL